jgi:predicted enzyme related to lactoylglutathione lyase
MATSRPRIAFYLTEILVTDWPGMVRWYVDVVGLQLTLQDAGHRYAMLEAGPGRIALKGGGGGPPGLPRDAVRLVFEVADVDAERDRLARHGMVVGPPEDSPEGYRAIRFRDPEGTPITLFCWRTNWVTGR